jgi:transposase-like protein
MRKCPYCTSETQQRKIGHTKAGSQRYRCETCGRGYTPEPKEQGYPASLREPAVKLYVDGNNFRRIARHLQVNHQSVINWVNAYVANLPTQAPHPAQVTTIELDEVFTFVQKKKTESLS